MGQAPGGGGGQVTRQKNVLIFPIHERSMVVNSKNRGEMHRLNLHDTYDIRGTS
jgi:hypothetical protein